MRKPQSAPIIRAQFGYNSRKEVTQAAGRGSKASNVALLPWPGPHDEDARGPESCHFSFFFPFPCLAQTPECPDSAAQLLCAPPEQYDQQLAHPVKTGSVCLCADGGSRFLRQLFCLRQCACCLLKTVPCCTCVRPPTCPPTAIRDYPMLAVPAVSAGQDLAT
jgi:hypothetical protein